MTELEYIDKFEQYLNGNLCGEELELFKSMLKENPSVAEKLSLHQEFRAKFLKYAQRKRIREIVKDTQREMDLEKQRSASGAKGKFFYYVAAACVSAVMIGGAFYSGYHFSTDEKEPFSFQELKVQVQKLEAKQDALLQNLDSDSKKSKLQAQFSGTGFLISKGYLLTNYHLVKEADSVTVYNKAFGAIGAEVIALDRRYDLALLRIAADKLPAQTKLPFTFRKKEIEPAEEVFTMGYPREDMVYGEGSLSSTSGYAGDSLEYQISIPVNPGNSGAPLLDKDGNIAGIIRGKQSEAEGTGFAVKSKYIQEFLAPFINSKEIRMSGNTIAGLNRKDKVKKLTPFVFQVKVY